MLIEENRVYATIIFLAGTLSIALAIYAWNRRLSPGALPLSGLMAATSLWIVAGGLSGISSDVDNSLFWYKIVYFSIAFIPVLFFIMVLDYTGREKWLTWQRIIPLLIIPMTTVFIIWVFPGLFFHITMHQEGSLWFRGSINPGLWFFVHSIYNYSLLLAGMILLINQARRTHGMYRLQVISFLIGFIPPVSISVVTTLEIIPAGLTVISLPISFLFMGFIISYALFRFKLLNLLPVARTILVDTMDDAMLVFNEKNEIVDLNPAASKLVGISFMEAIGNSIFCILNHWPDLVEQLQNSTNSKMQLKLKKDNDTFDFMVQIAPIYDDRKRTRGRMIILRDVSSLVHANERLLEQMEEIRELQAELREQAIRDPLTGLFNRRYLSETLERELARALREDYPVSIVMLDIDQFKKVNDTYGHQAGDYVLVTIGKNLRAHTRAGDIACRYGGEEFLMVLPNTSLEIATQRSEHWRLVFQELAIPWENIQIRSTFSLGLAAFPKHGSNGDEIVAAADSAVYAAKARGGNQVIVWEGT